MYFRVDKGMFDNEVSVINKKFGIKNKLVFNFFIIQHKDQISYYLQQLNGCY